MKNPEQKRFERVQGAYAAPPPVTPAPTDPPTTPQTPKKTEDSAGENSSPAAPTSPIHNLNTDGQVESNLGPGDDVEDEAAPTSPMVKTVARKLHFPEAGRPKKRVSKTKRSGLVMSVARIHGRMKKGRYAKLVRESASVFLAAALEYLVAEVLELAGNCARFHKKKRVTPRHIQLTLLHDQELERLTRGAIVPQGGVKPHIHPELLPRLDRRTGGHGSHTFPEDL